MSEQHHLGDDIHDLLDGRLSSARTCEAMAHLDACPECAMRWDELRAAREALKTSTAGIDLRFTQQLLDRDRMAEIAKGESKHRARAARGRDRRPLVGIVASVAVVIVGMAAAYRAGSPEEVALTFAEGTGPSESSVQFMGAHSMRSGDQLRSWVHPDWEETGLVPVEAKVVRSRTGANVLIASMLANLEPVVVTQQHGHLKDSLVARFETVDLGHTDAYVVSERPLQLVWQTGDVVIAASCSCALVTLHAVATTFPAQESPGFAERIVAGLGEFANAATGG